MNQIEFCWFGRSSNLILMSVTGRGTDWNSHMCRASLPIAGSEEGRALYGWEDLQRATQILDGRAWRLGVHERRFPISFLEQKAEPFYYVSASPHLSIAFCALWLAFWPFSLLGLI